MSHSKRNTSLAFFTAHERSEASAHWNPNKARLTRDSFLPFGSCQLCLLPARDPVSCPSHGHLFCRECALSNLLAQGKELKRLKKEAERRTLEDEQDKLTTTAEYEAKALEDFERVQAGLSAKGLVNRITGRRNGKIEVEQDHVEGGVKGVKHKLELDESELKRLASETRGDAKRHKRDEADGKTELPSIWAPSRIPDNQKSHLKAAKLNPTCPAAAEDKPHDFTLKTLVTVHFSEDKAAEGEEAGPRTCPSCNKLLSNSAKAVLAKPCGHVLCRPCSDKFQKPPEKSTHEAQADETARCYVCQEDVTPGRKIKRKKDRADGGEKEGKGERGLVELSSEGTGFAGGGKNMVKRDGVAFQC